MKIYADNAATTKLNMRAFDAMKPFLLEDFSNPSQPYSFSRKAKRALKQARADIADCIGAKENQIFFTSGGTESDNWAIKCFGIEGVVRRIVTSSIEHHAVLNACKKACNCTVTYLPVTKTGIVESNALHKALILQDAIPSCLTTLVSVMYANNEIGTVEPIKELVDTAKKSGALFHTDAVQAVGHIPIYANETGFDFLSASAHKFNGPKGIGFLYYRGGDILRPFADGGAQEFGMRAGTENVAAIVGMAEALKWNTEFMYANTAHLNRLTKVFLDGIKSIDYLLNGDPVNRLPGNISISIRGKSGEGLLHLLDLKGIMISTGSACDSVNTQTSHVIQAIGVDKDYAEGTIRITFGHENTEEEARTLAATLIQIVKM